MVPAVASPPAAGGDDGRTALRRRGRRWRSSSPPATRRARCPPCSASLLPQLRDGRRLPGRRRRVLRRHGRGRRGRGRGRATRRAEARRLDGEGVGLRGRCRRARGARMPPAGVPRRRRPPRRRRRPGPPGRGGGGRSAPAGVGAAVAPHGAPGGAAQRLLQHHGADGLHRPSRRSGRRVRTEPGLRPRPGLHPDRLRGGRRARPPERARRGGRGHRAGPPLPGREPPHGPAGRQLPHVPGGLRPLVQGWTKNIASGASERPLVVRAARGRVAVVPERRVDHVAVVLRRQRRAGARAGTPGRPVRRADGRGLPGAGAVLPRDLPALGGAHCPPAAGALEGPARWHLDDGCFAGRRSSGAAGGTKTRSR